MIKALFSQLYGLALNLWYLYDEILRTKDVLPAHVISIGNITTGGTGKTPLTIFLAQKLSTDRKVAILTRGYRRKGKGIYILKENTPLMRWEEVGDEPYLMWKKLRGGVPILIGKNRYETGQIAIRQFKCEVLLMDDGFQYLPLKRDIDIVCINQGTVIHGDYLLPRGTLREKFSALKRAHILVLNIKGDTLDHRAVEFLETYKKPIFVMKYEPVRFYNFEGQQISLNSLKGFDVAALSGIADPKSFIDLLTKIGITPKEIIAIRDHNIYPLPKLRALLKKFDYVVTTEKDLIKYPSFKNLLALELQVKIEREDEFLKLL
ncbi:MAG: tetraacyldisaccharide 4'-kinase [bacterium]|nr:tetraacyldisaccharide 4'-kinase [bacterium]